MNDWFDPWLRPGDKGFPATSAPLRRSQIGLQGWHVLGGALPFPIAVVKERALDANLGWLQRFVSERGLSLAPHGKTTMAPEIFRRQLAAGAWGLTFANVAQLAVGVAAGARRCIIANQVMDPLDLHGIDRLKQDTPGLQVAFLLDSSRQLELIEASAGATAHDVLIEIGVRGARTGCRSVDEALQLAERAHASGAVRLCGVECYEGLGATGDDAHDRRYVGELLGEVHAVLRHCDASGWFDGDEIIVSAGGSALFDLVADALLPALSRPLCGVLRSGCYVTHDDGMYARLGQGIARRLGCAIGLEAALEVWATVQSRPEPGLAILSAGKRDVSYDIELPRAVRWCRRGERTPVEVPQGWEITGLNDQHAYLRLRDDAVAPSVGDRVALGISHPCTTFDKWRWMAIVDDRYQVTGALTTLF